MRVALMLLGVVLVVTTASAEESKEWLGVYKGSSIPGFLVSKAMYMGVRQFGTQTNAIYYNEAVAFLKKECMTAKGVALTNVSLVFAVGPMHSVDPTKGSGLVQVLGKEIYASGDCVLGVEVSH